MNDNIKDNNEMNTETEKRTLLEQLGENGLNQSKTEQDAAVVSETENPHNTIEDISAEDLQQIDDSESVPDVEKYRRERVQKFKMEIHDGDNKPSDSLDEITSFSDENTKAQIERASKKELRRQKREDKKIARIKSGRNKKVFRIAWIFIVFLIGVVVVNFLLTGCNDFLAINRKDESEATVRLKSGFTVEELADALEDEGVINSKFFFSIFANITGKADNIAAGVYHIPKNMDYLGLLNFMQYSEARETVEIFITEGTNIEELAELLCTEGVFNEVGKNKFLKLCNSDKFDEDFEFLADIKKNPDRLYKLEGYLFPDTYEFYVDEDPEQTIYRFLNNFNNKVFREEHTIDGYEEPVVIAELLEENSDYTLDEIVNMAAIIQAEAADNEDMFDVSGVLHNRLENRYDADGNNVSHLGMDSTIFYPYKTQEAVPESIRDEFESKYDTYEAEGLPPGAICSPSLNALISAVNPADSDYLYFCHSAEGEAFYAETLYEHEENCIEAGLTDE